MAVLCWCLPRDTQRPRHQRQCCRGRPWEQLLPSSVYDFLKIVWYVFALFPSSVLFCLCPSLLSSAYLNLEFPTFSFLISCCLQLSVPCLLTDSHSCLRRRCKCRSLILPPTVLRWVLQTSVLHVWSRQQTSICSVNCWTYSVLGKRFGKPLTPDFVCFIKFWNEHFLNFGLFVGKTKYL